MVWIPGGVFTMGSDAHYPEEAPAHLANVDGFWMDRHAVTNEQFRRFVDATQYVTVAERRPNKADYPDARPEMLMPASAVFRNPGRRVDLREPYHWWIYVKGAQWRHPRGAGSSVRKLGDHPVVQIAWEDVQAYASWVGKQLPTEAEWEHAARGGLDAAEFAWGTEFMPQGQPMANTWQGEFPIQNLVLDGYEWTAPVGAFPPNGYGLYEMTGNVWEWTTDWYSAQHADTADHPCCAPVNPRGGGLEQSYDPQFPGVQIPRKVIKGGSYLCAENYCRRYRPAARSPQQIDTPTCHLGFRCIVRATPA
ncbi:MAG: formylglycine-generating enzyme family protein [Chloroflexi bacterium]|nr:formylglycine-generating enzyme family protein [Chloroflexota bacterium]